MYVEMAWNIVLKNTILVKKLFGSMNMYTVFKIVIQRKELMSLCVSVSLEQPVFVASVEQQ